MTWEQLQEWRAAIDIVGVDDDRRQVATLTSLLVSVANAFGGKEAEEIPPEAFMGLRTFEEVQPKKAASPQEQIAALRAMGRR